MACIDSRILSTTVASPCQTCDVRSIAYAQFAEGLHFSAFHSGKFWRRTDHEPQCIIQLQNLGALDADGTCIAHALVGTAN